MTDHPEHISFDELNDLVDGRLDRERVAAVDRHLGRCERCRAEHDRLRHLLAVTSTLPRSVLPQDDLWPSIRESLDHSKEIVLPVGAPPAPKRAVAFWPVARWRSAGLIAAAAVVLVVASSAVTAIVLGGRGQPDGFPSVPAPRSPAPRQVDAALLPAAFLDTEAEYVRTIAQLRGALDAQRGELSPETVRTVERSLAVVDSAIAEARAALLTDPNNRTIVDLLSASYQRKVELLKRASELGARI